MADDIRIIRGPEPEDSDTNAPSPGVSAAGRRRGVWRRLWRRIRSLLSSRTSVLPAVVIEHWEDADESVRTALESSAAELERAGVTVVWANAGITLTYVMEDGTKVELSRRFNSGGGRSRE